MMEKVTARVTRQLGYGRRRGKPRLYWSLGNDEAHVGTAER